MKKLFVVTALALAALAVQAAAVQDTVVITKADQVTIMTCDTTQTVQVLGKDGDKDYRYENSVPLNRWKMKKRQDDDSSDDSILFDLAVGVGTPTNVPDGIGFAPFKSMELLFGFRYEYTPKKALQSYSVGLWFDWRAYGLRNDNMFVKGADDVVGIGTMPENAKSKRSSINIFSLSVPFLFTQYFGRNTKWNISLGPVVNFNVYGRVNNEYEIGDDSFDISTKGLGYRPVTVDFMGMVRYKHIGVYCKYSPMSVLKKDMGPQFRSLTFGVFL